MTLAEEVGESEGKSWKIMLSGKKAEIVRRTIRFTGRSNVRRKV